MFVSITKLGVEASKIMNYILFLTTEIKIQSRLKHSDKVPECFDLTGFDLHKWRSDKFVTVLYGAHRVYAGKLGRV